MSVKPTDAVELFENHNNVIPFHLDEPDPPVRRRREREREREREEVEGGIKKTFLHFGVDKIWAPSDTFLFSCTFSGMSLHLLEDFLSLCSSASLMMAKN